MTARDGIAPPRATFGSHVLADLAGIDAVLLRDAARLESILTEAAQQAGARVIGAHFHHFGGDHGVTGVVLLAESHITIHTWPEHRFAAVDAFMCGAARAADAVDAIAAALGTQAQVRQQVARGGAPTSAGHSSP
ncbi:MULTISPECIES: adenosylmethionine decarboxylase [Burkholderia]|jgi:S-adenosylmethionine decarboxylase|uniref:S-adenosylmethionine decarboxylase proenzyme n=2 Tax=Burkholderia contaminans TaxID=488447 RepID=A0A1E3FK49_9BURK|nr:MULTISPECIES: adenosylmethionine decarboxylase [Burkholderia]UTP26140.1 adenosylmethionine decarboxylase [Burkholderia sp. FXe9]KKL29397.1 S-adenosylmethionine decarboxylase [Burkholderia contaminans LMG 23361]MBA9833000.1 adenosylmethionine decarboxylase [Burkholderia contaminans]MBA9838345.1 adenosylmethionine decarboxylase [Burkholderia contaminans]MBA9862954.1 adenosylmethionine decarboxylase [Burkholderia contaminans]